MPITERAMTCHDFLILLNREVDGRTSPEEEALLMQHIGTCPSCAAEQTAQHRIHRALQGLRSDDCPEGLGSRIAGAVLAAPAGRPIFRTTGWWSAGSLGRQAAAILVTAVLAGASGWFLGQDDRPVVAAPTGAADQQAQEHAIWVETYRLPPAVADRILKVKADYAGKRGRTPEPSQQHGQNEQETAEILRILAEHPAALEAYRKNAWISDGDYERLRTLDRR